MTGRRLRVDFEHGGYASFAEEEQERAWEAYRSIPGALRIRRCESIFDEGIVLDGSPIVVDLESEIRRCRSN